MICRKCGLKVTPWRDGWKHASGGANGKTKRRHKPEPIETPRDDSADVIAMLRDRARK